MEATCEGKSREVREQLTRASNEISVMGQKLETLENCLVDIIRPSDPEPSTGNLAEKEEAIVPLAEDIKALYRKAKNNNATLQGIIDRIEL